MAVFKRYGTPTSVSQIDSTYIQTFSSLKAIK